MNKNFFANATIFNSFGKFIGLNFLIATVLMIIQCPSCFLSWEGLWSLRFDYIFSFLMSASISLGGFKVEEFYDKRISWIAAPVKRLLLTTSTYLLYTFIISFVLISGYVLTTVEGVHLGNMNWYRILNSTLSTIVIAVIIITIFIARSWLYEWRHAALEAERLKTESISSQFQSLKDQLNPHFLFNSLNVLSNLVYESPDKSAAFIQQLAKIYRYVLDIQEEELVLVARELEFANSFLSLQKIRLEANFTYKIDIPTIPPAYIPPLSLQLLLENALKHNISSQEQPLNIHITLANDSLVISNNLQLKHSADIRSTGIGLRNIEKRYQLLSNKKPQIMQTAKEFTVTLPLLRISAL
ncbi:sensor histidine kinase [Mongoliitalea daihaiensis]|uniref:sensor histidine kinase n=1 Tax=Mongoliitalea daihaiensis TaxID=2782006 RepID=UPI001F402EB8|nr:histidine kinase [Mongoliitalea daihaiensis]UJP65110.1 histidine kinase [Mongoliitalea daihaiensis]